MKMSETILGILIFIMCMGGLLILLYGFSQVSQSEKDDILFIQEILQPQE